MPFHPQVAANFAALAEQKLPKLTDMPPAQARLEAARRRAGANLLKEPIAHISERLISGPGGDLSVRIYSHDQAELRGANACPLLMVFHGGGWVYGSPESEDTTARGLANRTGALVVSVDYRLAPETCFPGAADDCYAATLWAIEHAHELGIDASRVAIAGTSAGGNLSAVVALMLRDRNGPKLKHQVLFNPVVDYNPQTPSYIANANGCGMTREDMLWYWDCYVPNRADRVHPYASPLRAEDLTNLPPATIITAEFDVLRDEAETFASRLRDAGVDTQCTRYDGMVHGFNNQLGLYDCATQALDEAGARLREAFA
jgi:acetyl esterase